MVVVGILKEIAEGEQRVAVIPEHIKQLAHMGATALVEPGAGNSAGFTDNEYTEHGGELAHKTDILQKADVLLRVQAGALLPTREHEKYSAGQITVGFLEPYAPHPVFENIAQSGATALAVELIPRITRAQSMDALSSMANLAGYKGVLLAAEASPKLFPMMMTAAGTVPPARVLVIGAGVAGLQAIATAKRLGATVRAYDVRAQVKEQVESLGATFLEVALETQRENDSGYAREMSADTLKLQQELMAEAVSESDAIITTAAVPGKPSPTIISGAMVDAMQPGGVIVDIAAERGGNCELTTRGQRTHHRGVTIIGDINLPATMAYTASKLYSKNLSVILDHLVNEGAVSIDIEEEINSAAIVIHNGTVRRDAIKE